MNKALLTGLTFTTLASTLSLAQGLPPCVPCSDAQNELDNRPPDYPNYVPPKTLDTTGITKQGDTFYYAKGTAQEIKFHKAWVNNPNAPKLSMGGTIADGTDMNGANYLAFNTTVDGYDGKPWGSCLTLDACPKNNDDLMLIGASKSGIAAPKYVLMKNLMVKNAHNTVKGPHTDLFQTYQANQNNPLTKNTPEWYVIQDSILKNSDGNAIITADDQFKGRVYQNIYVDSHADAEFLADCEVRVTNKEVFNTCYPTAEITARCAPLNNSAADDAAIKVGCTKELLKQHGEKIDQCGDRLKAENDVKYNACVVQVETANKQVYNSCQAGIIAARVGKKSCGGGNNNLSGGSEWVPNNVIWDINVRTPGNKNTVGHETYKKSTAFADLGNVIVVGANYQTLKVMSYSLNRVGPEHKVFRYRYIEDALKEQPKPPFIELSCSGWKVPPPGCTHGLGPIPIKN